VLLLIYFEGHYLFLPFSEENKTTKLKYTFTPMHGVGQRFAELAFEAFNLPPFVSVREQVDVQDFVNLHAFFLCKYFDRYSRIYNHLLHTVPVHLVPYYGSFHCPVRNYVKCGNMHTTGLLFRSSCEVLGRYFRFLFF